jgi:hypothetical protein
LRVDKKLSVAALSQTLPDRLKLQITPCSAIGRWKASLAATIGMMQQLSGRPRRQIAITSASVASSAVIAALIDQATTRRENRWMTAAT